MENLSDMYKHEFYLKQHTPIIHFQHDQEGATLRATEVKPKLDKFLIKLKGGWNQIPILWKVDPENEQHKALDYKIRFISNSQPIRFENIRTITEADKNAILENKVIECIISSFNKELIDFIKINIKAFFVIHNFGNRQSKGWGSFLPNDITGNDFEQTLRNHSLIAFKKRMDGNHFDQNRYNSIIKDWRILKSGQQHPSYIKSKLFEYMCSKGIRWEKRWIKQQITNDRNNFPEGLRGTRPPVDCPRNNFDFKFVRILLGMPEHYEFQTNNNGIIYQVKIRSNNQDFAIERLKSPVDFKWFDNFIYLFISEDRLPTGIFNKSFEFIVHKKNRHNNREIGHPISIGSLSTPPGFNIVEFLSNYITASLGFQRINI